MKIVGRIAEQHILNELVHSDRSEFVAVYGRRRVGKTFLVREFFSNNFSFYLTGLANTGMRLQLHNFNTALHKYGKMPYPVANTWLEAFEQLEHLLTYTRRKGKKVIFLDELPWLDTHRSGFVAALEHFWNSWASARADILLVVCGSATSWMINKLIKNRGGLHNRITRRMLIEPFTLGECEEYYRKNHITMSRYQMLESYMVLGGIPYYLSLMDKRLSLAQNIDALCFSRNGALHDEFSNLYASLFRHSENHVTIVKALSRKTKGLTREEIITATKLPDGGGLTKNLEELEQCGFICKYNAFDKKSKCTMYQLIDFYTLFYMNFIYNNKHSDKHFWTNSINSARHRAWSGYSFEQVCMMHIRQIKEKLGISGILAHVASWRSQQQAGGSQVDMLIDRNDNVINICEMKYAGTEFVIDRKYDENLRNKKDTFLKETKTRKTVHLTMITTYGIKWNEYSGMIQSEIKMDDLF